MWFSVSNQIYAQSVCLANVYKMHSSVLFIVEQRPRADDPRLLRTNKTTRALLLVLWCYCKLLAQLVAWAIADVSVRSVNIDFTNLLTP